MSGESVLELPLVLEGTAWKVDGADTYNGMDDAASIPQREGAVSAAGQGFGVLANLRSQPLQATFLRDATPSRVKIDLAQFKTLQERGLGFQWSYYAQDGKLTTCSAAGGHSEAREALKRLSQFVAEVNSRKYDRAFQYQSRAQQGREPLKIFQENYSGRFLGSNPDDLKVVELRPGRVTLGVRLTLEAYSGQMKEFIEYPWIREGGEWRIDGCSVVHDESGTRF